MKLLTNAFLMVKIFSNNKYVIFSLLINFIIIVSGIKSTCDKLSAFQFCCLEEKSIRRVCEFLNN